MHALLFFCALFHVILNTASASGSPNGNGGTADHIPELRETGLEPDSVRIDSLGFLRPGDRSPEVPVEDDPEIGSTSGTGPEDETTTKKTAGFFKGIGDFFKHSFHMDKTTLPVRRTTATPEDSDLEQSLVAGSRFDEAIVGRGRSRGRSFSRNKQKGREATFNFRIKAVALPN